MQAFQIKPYQLVGPPWLSGERFDIVAKGPLGTGDDQKLMPLLRTLLTERFQLQTHREKRTLPCYELVVAKGGFQLHAVEDGEGSMNSRSNENGGELTAKKSSMDEFAEWMSRELELPVIDVTGIKGSYDFLLNTRRKTPTGLPVWTNIPILSLAIQEQLGLRLEKRTAPVDVVIIDRAERVPTEN